MGVIDNDETPRRKEQPVPELPKPLELDGLGVLAPIGVPPSTGDFQFAQQMTYAVAMITYDRFRQALGRTPDFSFGQKRSGEPGDPDGMVKLHIYPHGMKEDNAYYDPDRGALRFGYTFANRRAVGMNQPGGIIYTSLSHDVVVHETAHAMLDGMRAKFMLPSNGDVDAFHEGFADLVAVRGIYSGKTAALRAVGRRNGEPPSAELVDLLTGEAVRLAHQFLDIIIRAVDYCPPVDLTFGEYLRALVTGDFDVVPEDPWGYREALVQAFRRYRITVDGVDDLSEESLLWKTPTRRMGPIEGLAFDKLAHQREPGLMSTVTERRRRADELGRSVTRPRHLEP